MMIDAKLLTTTVRRVQRRQFAETIQAKRADLAAQHAAGRLRHADLEEALKEQCRQLDAMAGALQACDELLAALEQQL